MYGGAGEEKSGMSIFPVRRPFSLTMAVAMGRNALHKAFPSEAEGIFPVRLFLPEFFPNRFDHIEYLKEDFHDFRVKMRS